MKLERGHNVLLEEIARRFAEFNRVSVPSKGRHYPIALQRLVGQAVAEGVPPSAIKAAASIARSSISIWSKRQAKAPVARRLEVVDPRPAALALSAVIRLPSGISIEVLDGRCLTEGLIANLCKIEVAHVASC